MRATILARAVLLLGLALPALPATTADAAAGDWFVLRQRESGDCWTARLIRVNGQLVTGSDQVAGGPFSSRKEAEARIEQLTTLGTCRPD